MTSGRDSSTVAALHPSDSIELAFKEQRQGSRLHGSHLMTLRHASKTSESARHYYPGDPPKLIDWRAFGRTDELLIREVRDEVTARVRIVLELSETMEWPDEGVKSGLGPIPRKAEVAMRLALHLANTHLQMGDLVSIWASTDSKGYAVYRPPSSTDVLSTFDHLVDHGFVTPEFMAVTSVEDAEGVVADVVYVITDFLGSFDEEHELAAGRKCCWLHLLSSREWDIQWLTDKICYFDEASGKKEFLGRTLKTSDYREQMKDWSENLRRRIEKRGNVYMLLTESIAISNYLASLETFVEQRNAEYPWQA